ncbi:DUF6318 family protein [Cellulomonas fengjieae]|uniref:DUF6318 domain-containing protein n=1 Tax=Cellulomonas fengjieae TaxID=2819978 RepID=A0ABS3SG56_9CELL|nr:DUF6318 family protein [Cellulomonas fengjieae]MBO3084713.1 hypothetical protein [Cellulomonas fengjieae]QVI66964.1 hypothetical protein KG102_05090 [Cellulomonas fengjieae]
MPPEAMSTPSGDGAAAAATYFTQLYAYAYATADLTAWKAMSEPDCQFCNSVTEDINSMILERGSETSAPIVVTSAVGTPIEPGAFYSATVHMHQGASTRYDRDGNVVTTGVARSYELLFALAWRDGWFVRQIDTTTLDETAAP